MIPVRNTGDRIPKLEPVIKNSCFRIGEYGLVMLIRDLGAVKLQLSKKMKNSAEILLSAESVILKLLKTPYLLYIKVSCVCIHISLAMS